MKALKCIRKAGGLDSYLLSTSNQQIRSQFGELLKSYIQKKKEDPLWKVPYIPRTWTKPKRWNDNKELMSSVIWKPAELKDQDWTKDMFDPFDPTAPPPVYDGENVSVDVAADSYENADVSSPTINKLRRQYDDDNKDTLNSLIDTARQIGIDDEAEPDSDKKQKQKEPEKTGKKSRSRLLREAKLKKFEDNISGANYIEAKEVNILKEQIFKLKGITNKKDEDGKKSKNKNKNKGGK